MTNTNLPTLDPFSTTPKEKPTPIGDRMGFFEDDLEKKEPAQSQGPQILGSISFKVRETALDLGRATLDAGKDLILDNIFGLKLKAEAPEVNSENGNLAQNPQEQKDLAEKRRKLAHYETIVRNDAALVQQTNEEIFKESQRLDVDVNIILENPLGTSKDRSDEIKFTPKLARTKTPNEIAKLRIGQLHQEKAIQDWADDAAEQATAEIEARAKTGTTVGFQMRKGELDMKAERTAGGHFTSNIG